MRIRIVVGLALLTGIFQPIGLGQKPPAPAPGPAPSPPPVTGPVTLPSSGPLNPNNPNTMPGQPDVVMFLTGKVVTSDSTPLPSNVMVERVCNARVRQQVYATAHGDFSMQLGSMADSILDASAEGGTRAGMANRVMNGGISRRELTNCEMRASVAGFGSKAVSLMALDAFNSTIDVGAIVLQRREKIEGTAISAVPFKTPKDARKAYEKGMEAQRDGRLAEARQSFEKAVQLYPKFTNAWYQLGTVLRRDDRREEAGKAFTQATTIDSKFLPPYLGLSWLAYQAENWRELLNLTDHILDQDPLNHVRVSGYILDLDPMDYSEAYFYNAMAHFHLNHMEEAEKSALKAERLDLRTRFPRLHLLLAEIFSRRNNYTGAIAEAKAYLDLAPNAKDASKVRERLAKMEKENAAGASGEKSEPN